MKKVTFLNKYGEYVEMWSRKDIFEKRKFVVLKMVETEKDPVQCWEDYTFLSKEQADIKILRYINSCIEMKMISNVEIL